ncbi:NlpC/P60 family protein [Clostridium peptidivorans]|uniref:C40 family peptidase n=1 Tax=Clostridium peptidivorans TaxID=100174 RepID=UPI000BE23D2F|nr:C40 family peptidase [Clostridium peptidivorans]
MNKRIKIYASILTVVLMSSSAVQAAPRVNSTTRINNRQVTGSVQDRVQEAENKIEEFDNKIESTLAEVESYKKKISETENSIKKSDQELKETEKKLKEQEEKFKDRMRFMYISGQTGYIEVLFDSEGFGDFISRIDMVKSILSHDKKALASIKSNKEQIENKKKQLTNEKEKLIGLKKDSENKLAKAREDMKEQKKLIAKLNQESRVYASNIQVATTSSNSNVKNTGNSNYTPSRGGTVSGDAGQVLAYAQKFLGTPYLWGGTTPSGFDCSGFTQYVFRHFGINLGRTTYDQINDGVPVSREDLQPGDLVFFGNSSPTHVGIYAGNNTYIHAPRTGDVIKFSEMTRKDFITGRRVLR